MTITTAYYNSFYYISTCRLSEKKKQKKKKVDQGLFNSFKYKITPFIIFASVKPANIH